MTGLEPDVLVRTVMQDDARQSPKAPRLVGSLTSESPGFVPLVATVELAWVLTGAHGLERRQRVDAFEGLLRTKEIVVDRTETVCKALRLFRRGHADFAEGLIEPIAATAGCERTMTIDRAAAKGRGMALAG